MLTILHRPASVLSELLLRTVEVNLQFDWFLLQMSVIVSLISLHMIPIVAQYVCFVMMAVLVLML